MKDLTCILSSIVCKISMCIEGFCNIINKLRCISQLVPRSYFCMYTHLTSRCPQRNTDGQCIDVKQRPKAPF